ncbi:MAG: hypothetical protein WAQ98_11225 [Blastocatellia bacterium]
MMGIQENKNEVKQMLPIAKSHMCCCHTDVAVRTSNPVKCAVCGDAEWWNKHRQSKYKPRKDNIKLHCAQCNKDYYVTPKVLAIKRSMNEEIKFAETIQEIEQLPKATNG